MNDFYKESFEKINWTSNKVRGGRFELCTFKNCDFQSVNFMDVVFEECTFHSCNFVGSFLSDVAFRKVDWIACKLTGISFEQVNKLGLEMSFDACVMDYAIFYQLNMPRTKFKNVSLIGADFTEADLKAATLQNSDLKKAIFKRTNLEKCDFRGAKHIQINLNENRVKGALFNRDQALELLQGFQLDFR